jgi:tetratricopeptide (TPR) repeat protein
MSAQSEGEYAEALQNYYQAMRLEVDPYDRSYILYNIGLIHTSNGEHAKALEYYFQAIERNPSLPQAFNNMAVICHYVRPFILLILLIFLVILVIELCHVNTLILL